MARREEPKAEEARTEEKKIETFGSEAYLESARAMREVGARVALTIGAAILIWLFGQMVFIPISKGMEQVFLGYPVHTIISFIFAATLAIIIFTVFIDIRRLTSGIAGVLAYQFGKVSGEITVESFRHYRIALDGILYVIIVSLTYLLFAQYLGDIHPAIPAIVLILIVIWSIFALWRSCRAIAAEIGRYTSKFADELESHAKKA
ncbi:MAG TPA: hypothetical protein VMW36_05190 [Patescibacteria group bacterium]|nr:hypothetical protein [Patescibacteria group bacterium]